MQRNAGGAVGPEEFEDIQSLNRLMEVLSPKKLLEEDESPKDPSQVVAVSTRISDEPMSRPKRLTRRTTQDVLDVQGIRLQRLRIAQDEDLDPW